MTAQRSVKKPKVLAVCSSGGHWEQMMMIRDAFKGADPVFVTTLPGLAEKSGVEKAYVVPDCNRDNIGANLRCMKDLLNIIRTERPSVIISTGAAPGLLAIVIGRFLFGARGIWVDSIANSERLSMSGKMAGYVANLWITQWSQLAGARGPKYYGSVL